MSKKSLYIKKNFKILLKELTLKHEKHKKHGKHGVSTKTGEACL